jgi:CrcB protein
VRKYIYISIGGVLGAVSRYLINGIHIYHYHENVPVNTLVINVAGSFLLALILTTAIEVWEFDADLRIGITTGFLGAFTTFSALCKETVGLLNEGFYFSAISYITVSTMLGLAAAYFGIVLAREAVSKLVKRNKDEINITSIKDAEDGVK